MLLGKFVWFLHIHRHHSFTLWTLNRNETQISEGNDDLFVHGKHYDRSAFAVEVLARFFCARLRRHPRLVS